MSHEQNECHCTPRLRFPEFANSAWYQKKIGDVCRLQAGSFISASSLKKECSNKLYPCYGGNGLRGFVDTFNCDGEFPLIGRQGELCGNVKFVCGRFYATEHAVIVNVAIENCIKFIYYLLIYTNLNRFSVGQAQPGLAVTSLNKIVIVIPQLKEQQKIADCLTSLDDLITAHEQKRDALTQHKKGLMQRLFPAEGETTPRWRFPEFREAGEWTTYCLKEVADVLSGYGFPDKYQGNSMGTYPFYKVSDISAAQKKGMYISASINYVDKKIVDIIKAKLIPRHTIIFARIGEAIRLNRRSITTRSCVIDNNVAGIKAKDKIVFYLFLYYISCLINMEEYAGGVVPAINKASLESIPVKIPTLPEQQKIADCLSSLDERIAAQEAKIAALREHKKGLMQQLFPQ